jgi:hypothetical protein
MTVWLLMAIGYVYSEEDKLEAILTVIVLVLILTALAGAPYIIKLVILLVKTVVMVVKTIVNIILMGILWYITIIGGIIIFLLSD